MTGDQVKKRLDQNYYDDVLAAGSGASLLPEDMTKEEFDLKLAGSMNKSESVPFVLDLDKCVYVDIGEEDEDPNYIQVPLIAVPLNQTYKKQYNYGYNVYSETTQFKNGVQVVQEGLEEIANPITPEYAAQIVKAFVEGRPFYGKSFYELDPSKVVNGVANIPPTYDYNIFPISIKNIESRGYYQDETHFNAVFSITIPAKVGQVNPSLGIIPDKIDLYLKLSSADEENFSYRAARYTRNSGDKAREANSPQVNGLLDLHKMMSFPDLLTLNKGDQLNVDFSADFLSSGFDFPGANVGNAYYESYGYIYSSDFKMVHYDDNTKKFIYVPVSTNITLSDDKQSFQKIVCDFELDNKKYHMVFDYQQDNGLILTEKYSYDNNQTPFILDLDKKVRTGSVDSYQYKYILHALFDHYKDNGLWNLQSELLGQLDEYSQQEQNQQLAYTEKDALELYNAIISHRPIFGKMGYQKNPVAPDLVKTPDIIPLYCNIYQGSDFVYQNDNSFDLTFMFFINYPIGVDNPSLGFNWFGTMPFGLRFLKDSEDLPMRWGIIYGTQNPSVYSSCLIQPKLKGIFDSYPLIGNNILDLQQGQTLSISNKDIKIFFKKQPSWIDGSYYDHRSTILSFESKGMSIPYSINTQYDDLNNVSGFTIEYQYQSKINILKFVISETQDGVDETYFTLQSRDIYDVSSSGKRLYLGQIDVTGDFAPGTPTYNIQNIKELFNYIQSASEEDDINAIYTKMDSKDAQLGYFITDNGSYRVTFFVDRQNSFYANAGESGFYIYIPGDLDNVIAVLTADQESGALPLAEVSLIQRGFANGGRVKLNVDNIEKFGEEAVNDSDITNPSNILHYAIQDAITVSEASGNVSYKESSLLKDICDYVINNDIRRGYFYTNIALGGGSGPEYKTQFFVDYDVIYTSNNPDDLYNKVVKIYSPFNEGKNPSLAVYINEDGIINIETNNLGYRDYYLNFDPSKNDGEYNAFQINYSSLYDKSNFIFTYNDGDETGNVDQKIYYLHFNNTSTFAKNDVIFSLYNDTNKSIEVRINEVTISMAPYETITFQYLMMGSDRFIHRLYVSNVNPMN